MAKVKKETLTPKRQPELDAQKMTDDGMPEEETQSNDNARDDDATDVDTNQTTDSDSETTDFPPDADSPENDGKDAVDTGDIKQSCRHDWVFHASQIYKDHPGKRFVYERCTKCNELKLEIRVETVHR